MIFVDLSLAQVAAFGSILAVLLEPIKALFRPTLVSISNLYSFRYLFLAKKYEKNFSQEAIIGIVYALSSALVILLVEDMLTD